jgi:uncharacterized paraquat-inducible protein A
MEFDIDGTGRRFFLCHPKKYFITEEDVTMSLKPKQISCQCGHTFTSSRDRSWCEKCASAVYYHAKDKNKAKLNNMYVTGVIVAVITFLTYVFMELIANPLLTL